MVARSAEEAAVSACLAALEASLAGSASPSESIADFSPRTLEAALGALARQRGESAISLLTALAESGPTKAGRRAARRVLYRLTQAGIRLPPPPAKPVVQRQPARALRAWVSGVDGTGSRAVWILFEGSFGGLALCALIVNDQAGILEVAGGAISKKRLEAELRSLRKSQKLPWIEMPPERATHLVAEALALHRRLDTEPTRDFARWRRLFGEASPGAPTPQPLAVDPTGSPMTPDPTLLDHSAELLALPELASWFVDPGALQSEALELLQAKESRLVLADRIKAEREAAIVERVVDRAFAAEARELWARRLTEMAWIFHATGRPREARLAAATALALQDPERFPRHLPFARGLAERGLAFASEVALGRVSATEVSRTPRPPRPLDGRGVNPS
ncbi:MAG: hypothetical protein HY725_04450 [Candidatus Rokubacteria bacterium]|nr:hypothetical protein [Candidatus Rokubacteria bacterium]